MNAHPPCRLTLPDGTVLLSLHDGVYEASADILLDAAGPAETEALRADYPDGFRADVNVFALERDDGVMLFDTGAGHSFGPALGHVPGALDAAGVAPERVAAILFTHLHGDHALGLFTEDDALRFPDAEIWCARIDLEHYGSAANRAAAPEAARAAYDLARRVIDRAGARLRVFDAGELLPGIEAVPLPGHTPGHTGFLIGSLTLLTGDVFQVASRQGARPSIHLAFDADAALAERTRRDTLETASARDWLVLGSHIGFPGVVRIATGTDGYRFVPDPAANDAVDPELGRSS